MGAARRVCQGGSQMMTTPLPPAPAPRQPRGLSPASEKARETSVRAPSYTRVKAAAQTCRPAPPRGCPAAASARRPGSRFAMHPCSCRLCGCPPEPTPARGSRPGSGFRVKAANPKAETGWGAVARQADTEEAGQGEGGFLRDGGRTEAACGPERGQAALPHLLPTERRVHNVLPGGQCGRREGPAELGAGGGRLQPGLCQRWVRV